MYYRCTKYLRASLTVTNTNVDDQSAEVRRGRGTQLTDSTYGNNPLPLCTPNPACLFNHWSSLLFLWRRSSSDIFCVECTYIHTYQAARLLPTYLPTLLIPVADRKSNTANTKVHQWTEFWASSIRLPSSYYRAISLNDIFPSRIQGDHFSSNVRTKMLYTFLDISHPRYMPSPWKPS
jgi:hypothetical protein